MFKSKDLLYHSIAILTVIIWGTTFVSTKIQKCIFFNICLIHIPPPLFVPFCLTFTTDFILIQLQNQ